MVKCICYFWLLGNEFYNLSELRYIIYDVNVFLIVFFYWRVLNFYLELINKSILIK